MQGDDHWRSVHDADGLDGVDDVDGVDGDDHWRLS